MPHPLRLTCLGGHFTLPRDVLVSFSDGTACAEAELLADRLRKRLLLTASIVDSQVWHQGMKNHVPW